MDTVALDDSDPLKDLAVIEPDDFNKDIDAWQLNDRPAASGYKGKARQLYHAARVFIGLDKRREEVLFTIENDKRKREEVEWYAAQPKQTRVIQSEPPR